MEPRCHRGSAQGRRSNRRHPLHSRDEIISLKTAWLAQGLEWAHCLEPGPSAGVLFTPKRLPVVIQRANLCMQSKKIPNSSFISLAVTVTQGQGTSFKGSLDGILGPENANKENQNCVFIFYLAVPGNLWAFGFYKVWCVLWVLL